MDTLEIVIQTLTSDEVRRFKILSNRFKADEEKKLLILFDAIRSEKYLGKEDNLLIDIYGGTDPKTKNRYYRLRNKLLDNIEKSLVFYHFKYKDSIHAYYDIQLAVMFKERGNYELALYFLKKASKKARALDQFNILEIIYEEYVQLAIKNINIDIESILAERKENLKKIEIHRNNTEAIAVIKQQLKKSKFSQSKGSVLELLNKLRAKIEKSADIFQSTEGRILVFRTVSTILHSRGAYKQLSEYLFKTIADFEQGKLFNKDNHAVRLLMRIRLIISLYNTYRLNEAMEQLKIFEREMKMFGKQNFNTYIFNYYNIKIYSLKLLGRAKDTFDTIHDALKIHEIKNDLVNLNIIRISLAGEYFNIGDYSKAIATLEEIQKSKHYSDMDIEIRFYLNLFNMICHFQSGDYNLVLKDYKSFKKKFRKLIKDPENQKSARFIEIFIRMNDAAMNDRRVSLRSAVLGFEKAFVKSKPNDNEILNPGLWLRSHLENRSYNELFLEDVRKKITG